ncbi:unnamed protein product [Wuchereria bancrofti]|uniref:Uncharacterized protein n=1 Tax=Wuchereria bancrofti TaxID=6293 RepID=A0A3P7DC50_WUCBA|nr:unnamed protein product [Wuchereria bancrofti]
MLCSVIGMQRWSKPLPISPFILPITTQIIIVLLLNRIHSQIRSGSLYLLRVFDFLTTITVAKFSKWLLRSERNPPISLLQKFAERYIRAAEPLSTALASHATINQRLEGG